MLCRALQGAIVLQAISYVWGADGISFGVSDEVLGFAGRRIGQGDPFVPLEPIKTGSSQDSWCQWAGLGQDIAIRQGWGPQSIAIDFNREMKFSGLKNTRALVNIEVKLKVNTCKRRPRNEGG